MRIAIDISPIIYGSGVSVYLTNLLTEILRLDRQNDYLLFGGSLRRQEELRYKARALSPKAKVKTLPFPPFAADLVWNRLHLVKPEVLLGRLDLFHSSDWTQPPTRAAKVTTIHDLSFLRWPESVHPKVYAAQRRRLTWVKKEADAIIAVSEATKKETVELLQIPPEKITVIHEALPLDAGKPADKKVLSKLKDKFGITRPYYFAYGSQAPRKNIDRVVEAFAGLNKSGDYQLVIIGEYHLAKPVPGVVATGFLTRPELLTVFAGAEALVYPSLYEGFGLVILEAFSYGVPVVTSKVSSMPEVAGEAAVLVDPESVGSIRRGMERAFRNRADLSRLGRQRLKHFSWEKAARETIAVYEKSLREKNIRQLY